MRSIIGTYFISHNATASTALVGRVEGVVDGVVALRVYQNGRAADETLPQLKRERHLRYMTVASLEDFCFYRTLAGFKRGLRKVSRGTNLVTEATRVG